MDIFDFYQGKVGSKSGRLPTTAWCTSRSISWWRGNVKGPSLMLPAQPSDPDHGLLTASEAAQIEPNADWVVRSACNTASAEKPGAEALSGLARAFFYAGARALLVSHWPVESDLAAQLMTTIFASIAKDPKLTTAEAFRQAMLSTMNDRTHTEWANPSSWAPFILVGEGGVMRR